MPMFEAAIAITAVPGAEEWMTKLWFACAGMYTARDVELQRELVGLDMYNFESTHVHRIFVGSEPFLGDACVCVDRNWLGREQDEDEEKRHEVLESYIDPHILRVHDSGCDSEDPLPLAPTLTIFQAWESPQFRDMLKAALGKAGRDEAEQAVKTLQSKLNEFEVILLRLDRPFAEETQKALALQVPPLVNLADLNTSNGRSVLKYMCL
jgi:hypothetical protein